MYLLAREYFMKIVYFLTLSLLFVTPSFTFGMASHDNAHLANAAEIKDRLHKLETLITNAQQQKKAKAISLNKRRATLGCLNLIISAIAGVAAYS
jgi:hypothetical protein